MLKQIIRCHFMSTLKISFSDTNKIKKSIQSSYNAEKKLKHINTRMFTKSQYNTHAFNTINKSIIKHWDTETNVFFP